MFFEAAVLQRVFSCIFFLPIFQGMSVITFFEDVNNKQQLVYNVVSSYCVAQQHTRSPANTSAASSSSTSSTLSLTEPLASSDNPRSNKYCHPWNDGCCHWPFGRCRFRHSCETCHKDHPCIHCPRRFARREQPRPLLSQRGVTAIILTQTKLHKWYKAFVMVFA